jgi:signal peptidase I
VVFATLIRWSTFEAYAIPSSSMERSLMTGDFLFVSKLHYGARAPITPMQVPLTHQTIWGTDIPSYSDIIQLPYFRFPGLSQIRRNESVVFNHPQEALRPVDLKTNLVKRCVGVAWDTLSIRSGQVWINGRAAENPVGLQFRYFVKTDLALNEKFFLSRGITDRYLVPGGYYIHITPLTAGRLRSIDFIK